MSDSGEIMTVGFIYSTCYYYYSILYLRVYEHCTLYSECTQRLLIILIVYCTKYSVLCVLY